MQVVTKIYSDKMEIVEVKAKKIFQLHGKIMLAVHRQKYIKDGIEKEVAGRWMVSEYTTGMIS